jgi:hypothetical protein
MGEPEEFLIHSSVENLIVVLPRDKKTGRRGGRMQHTKE